MTLRAITDGGWDAVVPAVQDVPVLDWVEVARLRIDECYQRPLGPENWKAIRQIAADFRWSRFSPVLVAPLDGGLFAVIDGQHRVHAAHLCGMARVPAMIVAAGVQGQADAFAAVNGRITRMSALNLYRAALAAGEGWAERCDAVVASAGCVLRTVNCSTKDKKPGEVFCVGLIRDLVVTRGHAEAVRAGLAALRAHDLRGRVALYSDFVLKPWLTGIALARGWERADLGAILRRHDPYQVIERADRLRAAGEVQGTLVAVRQKAFAALVEQSAQIGVAA